MPKWKEIAGHAYTTSLEILPPALWIKKGFLIGEPTTHRKCTISGHVVPVYGAFIEYAGKYYECLEPLSAAEFRAVEEWKLEIAEEGDG